MGKPKLRDCPEHPTEWFLTSFSSLRSCHLPTEVGPCWHADTKHAHTPQARVETWPHCGRVSFFFPEIYMWIQWHYYKVLPKGRTGTSGVVMGTMKSKQEKSKNQMCWKSDGQSTAMGKKEEEERDHTMVHSGFSRVPRFSETLSYSTN